VELAQGYLQIGRDTADPRFTSYAQATIAPWLREARPPVAVLILNAIALQSSHQFDASVAMLDRALRAEPANAQAWLTKATVLQVQGKFSDARRACVQLVQSAGQIVAVSCIANVNSLSGQLEQSYRSLQDLLAGAASASPQLRSWISGQLGEMAVRISDPLAAENFFLAALKAVPGDVYIKAAYADVLLSQHRPEEVLELLRDNEQQDVLLLRLAIAGRQLRSPAATSWADAFAARYEASQRTGDSSHLREYARFALEVRGDASLALQMAQRNWQIQREPADVRVYVAAALALGRADGAAEVMAWIRETGYEDRSLPSLPSHKAIP
jgi:tetratricopeptide (TPR) repeat protein